jgi:hypothetical protein
MTDLSIDEVAVRLVASIAADLTDVEDGECVYCYVARMMRQHGCDTSLRFTRHFRDQRAPRATAIERRMGQLGGFCDCEIFLNGVTVAHSLRTYDEGLAEWVSPAELLSCRGVRRGSTRGCDIWVRQTRWSW